MVRIHTTENSAHDVIPPDFASYLVGYVAEKVAAENEVNIWQGATGNSGEFDGFETLLASNASQPAAQELEGAAPTALTAANIVDKLEDVVDAIPAAVWGKEDLAIYMGTKATKFYIQAQAALGYLDKYHVGTTDYNFQGIKILHCPGMSDDTIVAARKSDLAFGTGLVSDHATVKVLDMADLDGSQNVRVIARLTAGAQFVNGEDITTYGINNTAN